MFELYSRRNRNIENDPDIYEYSFYDDRIRTQVFYLLSDAIEKTSESSPIFGSLHEFLLMELGRKNLSSMRTVNDYADFEKYWYECNTDEFIDLLDACVHFLTNVNKYSKYHYPNHHMLNIMRTNINRRLKQCNIGYEFIDDKLVRIDNMLLHTTIVKPTLYFLHQNEFKGTEDEIYRAFDYLKDEDYKSTVLYAAKAFESMMKTICSHKEYTYNKDKDTAKELIRILLENKYIPTYLENHLHAVRTSLESGLPTLRNKTGGHGQGDEVIEIHEAFAKYALNLACTNILFLASLY